MILRLRQFHSWQVPNDLNLRTMTLHIPPPTNRTSAISAKLFVDAAEPPRMTVVVLGCI